jgi:outer membrane immunogenic protein
MRRLRCILTGSKYLLASALVAGAFALALDDAKADGMRRAAAPPVQQATTWSGVYFGANSGWAFADIESNFVPAGTGNDSVDHDAQIVGGQLGIQHQFGNIVLGVEAGHSFAFRDNFANTVCPNPARTCGKRFDDVMTIGPRLGWAMGKYMPYLAGGYANASFSHESFLTATNGAQLVGRERFAGWYVGGGVDMALAAGWTIGLEYRHYEFEDKAFLTSDLVGNRSADVRNVDPSLDTVTVRVSWKFDRAPAIVAPPMK